MANTELRDAFKRLEDFAKKAGSADWLVYRLKNPAKREIYHGVTTDFDNRYDVHERGETKATKDWSFDKDGIVYKILKEGLDQESASKMAHALEDENPPSGWKNIQTGGI